MAHACRVPSAHLHVASLNGFSEKLSQCGGADNGAMTLQHIRNVVEPVTNGVLEINSGSSQPQSRHDTHNSLTQRDTLCSYEAYGMKPTKTYKGKNGATLSRTTRGDDARNCNTRSRLDVESGLFISRDHRACK